MKKILFYSLLIWQISAFSQQIITGKVIDATTREPLAFANITIGKNQGSITDFDGSFEIKIPENKTSITVSYIGYQSKTIEIISGKKYYDIQLKPSIENLETVIINGKYVNPAIALMKQAVQLKKSNNYQKKLKKYAYTKYIKFIAGAETDKINKEFDTIYKNGKFYKIDSTLYRFKKELSDKYMWMFESIIKVNANNGNEKSEIIATRTAGLKKPLYELLALQVSGQNVYEDYYKFFFQSYIGPFSKLSFKQYKYEIDDTINLQGRPVIVVDYKNTVKPLISGKIYLDKYTLAVAKLTLNTYKQIQFNSVYNFHYYPKTDVWFPADIQIRVKKAENTKGVNFGNAVSIQQTKRDTLINKQGDTLVQTRKKTELDYTYILSRIKILEVKLNQTYPIKIKYHMEVHPMAAQRDNEFWEKYTQKYISEKEKNTYQYIDSIAEKENLEKKIDKVRKLLYGYYPVHKYFDADYLHLFSRNRYEKFRIQIGGKTSENLSDKWQLSSYIAYGFGDKEFKYSGSLQYKLRHKSQTFIKASYTKDLIKSGSFEQGKTENILSMNHHLADDKFFMQKAYSIDFSHLITPFFKVDIDFTQGYAATKYNIPYHIGRLEFQDKDIAYFQTRMEITPFSKYILTPEGRKLIKDGYPKLYVSFEKNLPGLITDYADYYRIDIQSLIKKTYLNQHYTELMIRAGLAAKGTSIDKLYQPVSNDFSAKNPLKGFNLKKKFAFETMNDYEFVDNFLVTAHLRHSFQKLKIGKKSSIDLYLVGRVAFGLSYDANTYAGIKSLDQIYYESGIEFDRLFGSLGLGFYYRMGAYAYPDKWDNLSIRLSLNSAKLLGF